MQTITLHADKNTIDKLLEFISANKLNIKIDKQDKIKDEVLDTIEQIKKGTMKTYTFDDSLKRTDELLKSLKT
ncbi:hypothetical protein [Campylobacter ureolyticus]|mgnify:FL=1|uniref:Uncharacterized protein n=2 Tax=Campylobacter ureolyticus TaxID=827 RepID=A0A9Q4PVE3_9BACT|nr:hypothetical protein [Campylobacter ureolyticus]MCZ6159400.1 hypothetical protein [Campylobacter ureolyticus]MCZ6162608.1 hypothetical protein [Campylobacter ureolyticus]MCZ6164899.1 hypothetical protein [Campylobacter ureolyticus]MCZ6166698.1 hypothetical protein [Campylobacter ureolyticus]MCZ6174111.1 hypothetical protein [Campylobacter ureolyticus]